MITFGQRLTTGFEVLSAGSAAYTVPATKTKVVVTHARAMNYSANAETLTVHLVPSGESVANKYKVCEKDIAAGESALVAELTGESLSTGDFLHVSADSDGELNLSLVGTEWS